MGGKNSPFEHGHNFSGSPGSASSRAPTQPSNHIDLTRWRRLRTRPRRGGAVRGWRHACERLGTGARGRPFSIIAFTGRNGRIVAIDCIADPERVDQLGLAIVDD
jgi:hypothetical protein